MLAAASALLVVVVLGTATDRLGLLPVRSGSMAPALPVGSLVVVSPVDPDEVEVGDVLSFHPPGSSATVTHRVAGIDRRAGEVVVTTRGDANPAADPAPVRLVGPAWRARAVIPFVGTAIGWLASATVRLGAGVVLLAALVGEALRWVWRCVPEPGRPLVRLRRRPVPRPVRIRVRVR